VNSVELQDIETTTPVFPRLHHVGVVMPYVARAISLMELLGLSESYRGYVERYEALCIFTERNGASPLEFVVPTGGQLAKFNRGAGGIHHVAVEVDSIDAVAEELASRGMSLLETSPVRGAGDFVCNFLSPAYTGGVIVEFIESMPAGEGRDAAAYVDGALRIATGMREGNSRISDTNGRKGRK
jgi:hypothetical protein